MMFEVPTQNPENTREQKSREFRARLEAIKNRPLLVEDINSYFSDAVNALSRLSSDIRNEYGSMVQTVSFNPRHEEDSAMLYFGIDDGAIDTYLDEAIRRRSQVEILSRYVDNIDQSSRVIVRTDHHDVSMVPSDSNYYKPTNN